MFRSRFCNIDICSLILQSRKPLVRYISEMQMQETQESDFSTA